MSNMVRTQETWRLLVAPGWYLALLGGVMFDDLPIVITLVFALWTVAPGVMYSRLYSGRWWSWPATAVHNVGYFATYGFVAWATLFTGITVAWHLDAVAGFGRETWWFVCAILATLGVAYMYRKSYLATGAPHTPVRGFLFCTTLPVLVGVAIATGIPVLWARPIFIPLVLIWFVAVDACADEDRRSGRRAYVPLW